MTDAPMSVPPKSPKIKRGHPARMRSLLRSMDTEKAQQCFRGIWQLAYPKTMHAQLKTS
jgi:hypothetical protein